MFKTYRTSGHARYPGAVPCFLQRSQPCASTRLRSRLPSPTRSVPCTVSVRFSTPSAWSRVLPRRNSRPRSRVQRASYASSYPFSSSRRPRPSSARRPSLPARAQTVPECSHLCQGPVPTLAIPHVTSRMVYHVQFLQASSRSRLAPRTARARYPHTSSARTVSRSCPAKPGCRIDPSFLARRSTFVRLSAQP